MEGISFQSRAVLRWVVQRKGRWREKEQICGARLLLGMLELLCPTLTP